MTEAQVESMLRRSERSDPAWREKISPAHEPVDMVPSRRLVLPISPADRKALLGWSRRHGYLTAAALLRAGIAALLDANDVSPEEVPLWWRT